MRAALALLLVERIDDGEPASDPALFAAFLDLGPSPANGAPRAIVSASPEPFLRVDRVGAERVVATDPIKGTRPRGHDAAEDLRLRRQYRAEEAATKIPTKLLFPLLLTIFPAMLLVLAIFLPIFELQKQLAAR